MLRRVVITGLGVLACNGIGKEDFGMLALLGVPVYGVSPASMPVN